MTLDNSDVTFHQCDFTKNHESGIEVLTRSNLYLTKVTATQINAPILKMSSDSSMNKIMINNLKLSGTAEAYSTISIFGSNNIIEIKALQVTSLKASEKLFQIYGTGFITMSNTSIIESDIQDFLHLYGSHMKSKLEEISVQNSSIDTLVSLNEEKEALTFNLCFIE